MRMSVECVAFVIARVSWQRVPMVVVVNTLFVVMFLMIMFFVHMPVAMAVVVMPTLKASTNFKVDLTRIGRNNLNGEKHSSGTHNAESSF